MTKILLTVIFLASSLFAMSDKELAISIDLAGKQRMLTQKMSKEALLIKVNIDKKINAEKLKKTSMLFDKTLKGLEKGDKSLGLIPTDDKKIQSKLKKVENLWNPFYKNIKEVYSLKSNSNKPFQYIDSHNLELLKTMNEAVYMYAALGSKGGSKLKMATDINLAGKQRMLTQKIAKDLLLYQAQIEPKKALKSLASSINLFDKTLKGLYEGDADLKLVGTKLPKIRKQLDIVKSVWEKAKSLIPKAIKNPKDKELTKKVIAKLDKTKIEMNKAVILYTLSVNRIKQVMKLNSIINGFMAKKDTGKHLINLAGKQRMLTQRISKLAIECVANLIPDTCRRLEQFVALYQKTLFGFKNGDTELGLKPTKDSKALAQINKLIKMWKPFADAAIKVQNSNGKDTKALNYILTHNEELLKESNHLVELFDAIHQKDVNYIEKAQISLVDIAGRQRMLTQKMTKELLAIIQLHKNGYKDKLNKTIKLFDNSLKVLINGSKVYALPKVTNPQIKAQLLKVSKLWNKLMPFYHKSSLSKKELVLLLKVNPILLKEANRAVTLIENSTEY